MQDYRTTDMALAAVLASQGYEYTLTRLNRTKGAWDFTVSDSRNEELDDILDAYQEHKYQVEPRSFLEEVGRLRRELYNFLEVDPKPSPLSR